MNWIQFWVATFRLFRGPYQPHARALCRMILPCHSDLWVNEDHDNDNSCV